MTPIEQIREALEAAQIAIEGAHAGPYSFLPGQLRDWRKKRAAALSLLSSMEGQAKTEPVDRTELIRLLLDQVLLWMEVDVIPLKVGEVKESGIESLLNGVVKTSSLGLRFDKVLTALHPSLSVPCISVEDAMEAYQNHMLAFGLHIGMKTDRAADLRERLTKAAK